MQPPFPDDVELGQWNLIRVKREQCLGGDFNDNGHLAIPKQWSFELFEFEN